MGHDKATAGTAKSTLQRRGLLERFESNMFDSVKRDVFCHQYGGVCKRRFVGGLADGAMASNAAQREPRNH
jgi:hypothetical protein